jgi:hypothetical protein
MKIFLRRCVRTFAVTSLLFVSCIAAIGAADARTLAGVDCRSPPPQHCADACVPALLGDLGNAIEPKSGRKFFLDYPCDLKPNEKVVFILSIHGAGSIGNWQRHYFPALDHKDKYRLVIATPTAANSAEIFPGQPPVRMWTPDGDDQYLQNIVDLVFAELGQRNVKAFWLAGHSQGGMTSNRIVCTDYFKDKVDGWLSLSGGRIGPAAIAPDFFGPNGPPPALSGGGASSPRPGVATLPACDISYIFTSGELEIAGLPDTSPWAEKYQCAARERRADIVDDRKGYVTGATPGRPPSWGRDARPGTAEVFVYPRCKGKKVVADVVRMDKGHTEGLEPNVTEELIRLIVAAPGGKARKQS